MKRVSLKSLLIGTVLCGSFSAGVASAGEFFAGVGTHDVDLGIALCCFERGVDLQFGVRGEPFGRPLGGELRWQAFASANPSGGISYGTAGLVFRWPIGERFYLQPGLGVAVHTGSGSKMQLTPDKLYPGSRWLFAPEFYVGARVTPSLRMEAGLTHLSHAQLGGKQNPGFDGLALRGVYQFGRD